MPSIASAQAAHTAAEDLAETDRTFSTVGARANIADSIGAMLMDNAVMPTPKLDFAIGRSAIVAALKANPANAAARAEWAPVRVGVSADRTQGFTFGFMTIHETGKPDRRAKYLSYWVRRPEGWRVAFYKRAASPEGSVTARLDPALPPASVEPDPQRIQENLESLKAAEKAFSDRAQEVGVGPAFVEFGSEDAMNMGTGSDFTFGNSAIGELVGGGKRNPDRLVGRQGRVGRLERGPRRDLGIHPPARAQSGGTGGVSLLHRVAEGGARPALALRRGIGVQPLRRARFAGRFDGPLAAFSSISRTPSSSVNPFGSAPLGKVAWVVPSLT